MTLNETRCPSCERVLEVVKSRRVAVGRPFLECMQCKTLAPRATHEEWPLMRPADKAQLVGSGLALALALGLLPALLYGAVTAAIGRPSNVVVLATIAGVGLLIAVGVWAGALMQTVKRSQRRMVDPMYLARLAEFGMGRGGIRRNA